MESIIQKAINRLKSLYIIHIIVIASILIFNFILISQIYWLKKILQKLYLLSSIISIIFFIVPIISLIFICTKKLKKRNFNIFKILTLIFCVISITLGFFFSGILMMNAIESPEFCKECPFNLPIQEISNLIQSNKLNNKCKERRCVINTKNYEILEKNENDFYEYLCNYNPTSEFEEIEETSDNINNKMNNVNNNTTGTNSDNIKCNKVDKNNLIISDLENNYVFNFYDVCNPYVEFYSCERSKAPNKFELKENFVCPRTSYMTILITFCMLNIILNLVINFMPFKLEYNKYFEMTNPPRIVMPKSNSFNSTINSSQIPKDNNIETEDKFERAPTEILIIVNNKNKDNVNNINKNNKKDNQNKKEENNDENNINNELVIRKAKTKKVNISSMNEPKKIKVTNKENKEFKSTKNMRTVNNINFVKKIEDQEEEEEKKEKKIKNIDDENKVTLSFDDNTISTKRVILGNDNNSKF